jgi:quercetin dioxygenase-like cupin family protein
MPFAASDAVKPQTIGAIEGHAGYLGATVKPMMIGNDMVFLEIFRPKGLKDPEHAHPDHESMCYLVSGLMRCVIDGQEFIARPGSTWMHLPGVKHWHETLEDSVQIEIKSPPKRTWGG